jgi:hypothetical protein
MTKKKLPWLGEVSFAEAAFTDKMVIRDLPSWSKTKKPSSKRQLLVWLHFGGVAHALRNLGGTFYYPKIGRDIPAIAVVMAYLRLGAKDAAGKALVAMGLDQASAKTLIDSIPQPPAKLTEAEKRIKEVATADGRWANFVALYGDIYGQMFGDPSMTAYVDADDNIKLAKKPPASAAKLATVDKKGIGGLKARIKKGLTVGTGTVATTRKIRKSFFDEEDDDDSFF